MNICWSRLGQMFLSIAICFLATCQCQQWTGYHHQYNPLTSLWQRTNLNDNPATSTHDLLLQNSIRRPSSVGWRDSRSKPQWQTPMYKLKWQDPYSKPMWDLYKAYPPKTSSKRQPFKNTIDDGWIDGWRKQRKNKVRFNPMSYLKDTATPRQNAGGSWPEYIPPLSVIRPSMDDPHALLNLGR